MSEDPGFTIAKTGDTAMTVYRADDRLPGKIKENGFRRKDASLDSGAILAGLMKDPFSFAQTHVASNSPTMVSCAFNDGCGGYSNGRNVYKLDLGTWSKFTITHKLALAAPTIYADADTLDGASRFALSPGISPGEVDFLFDIPVANFVEVKLKTASGFGAIDWSVGDLGIAKGKVSDLLAKFGKK